MRGMIEKILAYYANECAVETADGLKTVRAFIQPVQSQSKGSFLRQMHTLGEIPEGRYIFIGPTAALPRENGFVRAGGREYAVCRAETLYLRDEPLYVWGLLRECGGAENAEGD